MLNEQTIINELISIEASAKVLMERAEKLRKQLQPVSTGSKIKKGLSADQLAKQRARRAKHFIKK